MAKVKVYHYPGCSTCKKALRWLDDHEVPYQAIDIVAAPPTVTQLRKILRKADVPLVKLFNTSGQSYRRGGYKDRLPQISEADALQALAADGMLIKRPVLVAEEFVLLGFREPEWVEHLG